jgi:cystathionine beta-lyase
LTGGIRAVRAALIPGRTKLVMLESPTNPRMQICDIATLSAIAHEVRPASQCLASQD